METRHNLNERAFVWWNQPTTSWLGCRVFVSPLERWGLSFAYHLRLPRRWFQAFEHMVEAWWWPTVHFVEGAAEVEVEEVLSLLYSRTIIWSKSWLKRSRPSTQLPLKFQLSTPRCALIDSDTDSVIHDASLLAPDASRTLARRGLRLNTAPPLPDLSHWSDVSGAFGQA